MFTDHQKRKNEVQNTEGQFHLCVNVLSQINGIASQMRCCKVFVMGSQVFWVVALHLTASTAFATKNTDVGSGGPAIF